MHSDNFASYLLISWSFFDRFSAPQAEIRAIFNVGAESGDLRPGQRAESAQWAQRGARARQTVWA